MAEVTDDDIKVLLREPPRVPRDIARFSADSDYGGPGIYAGPPMVPARPPPVTDEQAFAQLQSRALDPEAAQRWFDDPSLTRKAPEAGIRAGIALLAGTVAECAIRFLLDSGDITTISYGLPVGNGRIAGHGPHLTERLISERYRNEDVALLSGPVAHELLCSPIARCDGEEKFVHGILAMVHMQLLSRTPDLAAAGTELARRLNSISLSLFNSRQPLDPAFRFIAPDGPGTIPGGQPNMQTPDFWSIPFLSGHPDPVPIPAQVLSVLTAIGCDPDVLEQPLLYDEWTVRAIDDTATLGWLDWGRRATVGRALGVL